MAIRERTCTVCGGQFRYVIARGSDRLICSPTCKSQARAAQARQAGPCSVAGCGRRARAKGSAYCEAHYYRLRRKGSLADPVRKGFYQQKRGYVVRNLSGHPLETPGQHRRIYEHRAVYHAMHGDGPFRCYWCGVEVTWQTLNIDHLNDTRDDNDPKNLVASCPACNTWRGRDKTTAKIRAQGRQLTAFGRTMCMSEWAREIGIKPSSVSLRLMNGWPIERALSEPRGKTGPRAHVR